MKPVKGAKTLAHCLAYRKSTNDFVINVASLININPEDV